MAEHIMTFGKIEDEVYTQPKDRIPWKTEDMRHNKFKMMRRRFIYFTEKKFEHPGSLPEDQWK